MMEYEKQNPGMLWVKEVEALGQRKAGVTDKSCASCHGEVSKSMRGVAARYPAFDALEQRPVGLADRIRLCRQRNQLALPFAAESHDLLSLESHVALQSRGMTIVPDPDPRLERFRENGRRLYQQRV